MTRQALPVRTATVLALLMATGTPPMAAAGKLTPEELMQRHRESLGNEEALSSWWGTAGSALGRVDLVVGGSGHIEGPALFASDESRLTLLIEFGQASYAREHLVFDGERTRVGFMTPGTRSPLGEFLFTYRHLFEDGLFAGVLDRRWPLLGAMEDAKVKYGGLKKPAGEKLHRLQYRIKGGSDTEIALYFEPETFRHVRSEYEVTIAPPIGRSPAASSQERRTRTKVVETFAGFAEVDGLTLPTVWRIDYSSTGSRNSLIWKWTVTFNKMAVNQRVDEKYFSLVQASEPKD